MGFVFGETVIVHTRAVTGQDGDGNDVYGDTDVTHEGVAVYPRESVERVQGQDLNIIGLVCVFKPAIDVTATDQLTVRGHRYEIDGELGNYQSPVTGTSVTKLNLTRVTG